MLQQQFTCMTLFVNKKFLFRLFFCKIIFLMSGIESLLVVITIVFGFFINIRILRISVEKKLFSKKICQLYLMFYFFILIFQNLFFVVSPAKSLGIGLSMALVILFASKWKMIKQVNDFYLLEMRLIKGTHLKISSGKSLVDALSEQMGLIDDRFFEFRDCLSEFVSFRQQNLPELSNPRQNRLMVWVVDLVFNPVNAREKLQSYENKLQIEHDFRRRSGQALLSTKIQAAVMVIIYLGAAVFVIANYGFQKNFRHFSLSMCLFLSGVIWTLSIGRKIKWKV